jgi:hypothetical protein
MICIVTFVNFINVYISKNLYLIYKNLKNLNINKNLRQ